MERIIHLVPVNISLVGKFPCLLNHSQIWGCLLPLLVSFALQIEKVISNFTQGAHEFANQQKNVGYFFLLCIKIAYSIAK